ncbi:IS66 family insertion sequence element accessory protein TnpA [Archangium lipolyticum]|uniref:IS66 family insertion sequence element accessory protein TnpA n=1 Tax=Archangium lipolyticum TaxID=2970465 RepID=UPI002149B279|nr:transposase [Archangium lipolyticum]
MGRDTERVDATLEKAAASNYWSEAEAQVVLKAQEASGLSVAEFARRHGLGPQRLRWWKKRRAEEANPALAFIPVRVEAEPSSQAQQAPSGASMEVVLARGRRVRVEPGFDAHALARLVRALEEAC